jgi:hypothetical protein
MRTKADPTKRKPGRPRRGLEDHKRTNVTVRLDEELHAQLLDEAAQSGRSFNSEVQHRLRLSTAGATREAGLWLDIQAIQAVASGQVELIVTRDKTSRPEGVVIAQIPGEHIPTLRGALTDALATLNSEWFVKKQRLHSPGARALDKVRDKLRVALALIEQLTEAAALTDATSDSADTTPAQRIEHLAHAMIDLARSLRLPRSQTAPVVEPQTTHASRRRR